ncbi:hypothetical protein [Streptomyces torulosus]|uniref:hypothetical protein n=1 Tax=Streptomyces torulosus TaxID=68276 RepID=UPI0006EB9834|nr:hypothetical protein [Streptomyces torulosus]
MSVDNVEPSGVPSAPVLDCGETVASPSQETPCSASVPGAERGDAEALHVRCVLVEQCDPLAEREPTEQIVDALAHWQRGVAERMPLGRREGRKTQV